MFLFLGSCQNSFCSSRLWSQTLDFLVIKMNYYTHAIIYKRVKWVPQTVKVDQIARILLAQLAAHMSEVKPATAKLMDLE